MLIRHRGSAQSPRDVGNRLDLNQSSSLTNFTTSKVLLSPDLNIASETPFSIPIPSLTSAAPLDAAIILTSSLPPSSTAPSAVTITQPLPTSTTVSSSFSSSSLSSPSPSSPPLSPSSSHSSLPPPPSSRPSSSPSTSPPATVTSSSSAISSSSVSSFEPLAVPVFDSASVSDVTSVITTTSGAAPTTVTTIIAASASSVPSQPSSSPSFLENKAQSGAVFGVVALVVLAGIGYLASRLYRVMKKRRTDRETEDAAREAAMVKVRLDDDDYGRYSAPANPFDMMEYPNKPPLAASGFDMHANGGLGMGDFDRQRSATVVNPFLDNVSLHHQPIQYPPPYNSTRDTFDLAERGQSNLSPRTSTSSTDLIVAGSSAPTEALSNQQSRGSATTAWSNPSAAPGTRVQSSQSSSQQALPTTLPEAFGEGEAARPTPRVAAKSLKDYEDYQRTIARVLKIANE